MSTSPNEIHGLPRPGDVVAGRYRIEAELGSGAMGVVYSGFHIELGQRVALKFLRPDVAIDRSTVARFMREARTAAAVQSEHVVRVFDVARLEGGTPFLVMEHLSGTDLHALASRKGPLPVTELADYMVQTCDALAGVHAAGVIHRDLKPGNLFIVRRGDGSPLVKVLDFGVSKVIKGHEISGTPEPSLTAKGQFVGSTHYMSPEQLRSAKDVDCRSDIWALGVIMFKLLVGRHPFHSETVVGCFDAIMNEAPPSVSALRPDVPIEFERVILRCLEKDSIRRFQNVAELADALSPFASPSVQPVARRVRGTLIGSDAISADTRYIPLDAFPSDANGAPLSTRAGAFAADGAPLSARAGAFAADGSPISVHAGAFAADGSPISVHAGAFAAGGSPRSSQTGILAADGSPLSARAGTVDVLPPGVAAAPIVRTGEHNVAAPIIGPSFRRAPARSNRTLLVAGISVVALAITSGTAWRLLPGVRQALTPSDSPRAVSAIAEAARSVAATQTAALVGQLPQGAADAHGTLGKPDAAAGAAAGPTRAAQTSAAASTGGAKTVKSTTAGQTSKTGTSKTGTAAATSKTSRTQTQKKPAVVPTTRKRPTG